MTLLSNALTSISSNVTETMPAFFLHLPGIWVWKFLSNKNEFRSPTWVSLGLYGILRKHYFSYFFFFFYLKLRPKPGNIPTIFWSRFWFVCLICLFVFNFSHCRFHLFKGKNKKAITELNTWENFIYRHFYWDQSRLLEDLGRGGGGGEGGGSWKG